MDVIRFKRVEQSVGVLTVNRPQVRNALDWAAMYGLAEAVEQIQKMPDLRALILAGAGEQAFISGGDLRDLHGANSEEDGLHQYDLMTDALNRLASLPFPVIAAMEGATRGGGCEVALACDLRIAGEGATLGFAQINMAVTTGWGGAERLYRLVGYSRALELLLTGQVIGAQEALSLGLINQISVDGDALTSAVTLARHIAEMAPLAAHGVKEVLQGYATLSTEQAREQERTTFARLWGSADHTEASTAFLEKRKPTFQGK